MYERDYILRYRNFSHSNEWPYDPLYLLPIPEESEKYYFTYMTFSELYRSLFDFHTYPIQEFLEFSHAIPQLATKKYISILAKFEAKQDLDVRPSVIESTVTVDFEQGKEIFLNELDLVCKIA